MRLINAFNLVIMMAAMFFTWSAVAEPLKVHVLQNLSAAESQEMSSTLTTLGYLPSTKELFSESHNAIIVTRTLANEQEQASISIELVHQDHEHDLPRTIFQTKLSGNDLHSMLKAFPRPEAFNSQPTAPMAFQKSE